MLYFPGGVADRRDRVPRVRLVNLIAASTASPAIPARYLQPPAGFGQYVKRYLNLLDLLFITGNIPVWSTNLTTRAVATPKLVLADSGLAAHLTGMSLRRAASRQHQSDR